MIVAKHSIKPIPPYFDCFHMYITFIAKYFYSQSLAGRIELEIHSHSEGQNYVSFEG